ncbi:transporter substrate-binding domain-containing protein [Microvirga sp. M2]|uniref:transporter substrate-binding domain-containing protein n=1 Tax=Microvirga sp. M2 TaxID=3073270 RepID=UPI0039C17509
MQSGACLAIEEIASDPRFDFRFEAISIDPGGRGDEYAQGAQCLLAKERVTHVIGCYTSSSRKEVLPCFEKYDGVLWYPSHYEGFETSDNVVYTGASPNQHIVPLTGYLLRKCGKTAFCVGSNYVWAWENNRILREAVHAHGGKILAERYFQVGEVDFASVIHQIIELRPNFIFNTLIGVSSYAFFRELHRATRARGIDQPRMLPVASCSLSEPELQEIGPEACSGHISSSVYFESIDSERNMSFVGRYRTRFPNAGPTSADAEAPYVAVHLLARAIRQAGSPDMGPVLAALPSVAMEAPQGKVRIDPGNRHCYLTPRIGISNGNGGFDIIYESPHPVRPDPYLVWQDLTSSEMPQLRIVS